MAINLTQIVFRVRTDATAAQGGTPVWAAAQNVNVAVVPNVPFRIRIATANTGTTQSSAFQPTLQVSKNGGSYVGINTVSEVSCTDATNGASSNGQFLTTSLLTGISQTFQQSGNGQSGQYVTNGTGLSSTATTIFNNGYIESEWGLQLASPGATGNTYTFRIASLQTYSVTPSFTVSNTAVLAATEANDTISAAGNVPRAARLSIQEVADSLTGAGMVFTLATAALSATEAPDTLIGVASAIIGGALAVTEAPNTLTGTALGTNFGALTATEAPDTLVGSAFSPLIGVATALLSQTEAPNTLVAAGTVTGIAGSLSVLEANDTLVGAALAAALASLNAVEANDTLVGFGFPAALASLNLVEANDSLQSETLQGLNQWVQADPCEGDWTAVDPSTDLPVYPVVPPPFVMPVGP